MQISTRRLILLLFLIFICSLISFEAYEYRSELVLNLNQDNQYARENKELAKLADRKVVAIGDSIVYGWNFPDKINGYLMVNRGISGQTTNDLIDRFSGDAIKIKPQYVVILAGINDIAAGYEENYNDMDSTIQKATKNIQSMAANAQKKGIKPVICSVLPVNEIYRLPARDINNLVIQLNENLKMIANNEGFIYLDLYSAVLDTKNGMLIKDYSNDGIHPNEKGYQQMWILLADQLK